MFVCGSTLDELVAWLRACVWQYAGCVGGLVTCLCVAVWWMSWQLGYVFVCGSMLDELVAWLRACYAPFCSVLADTLYHSECMEDTVIYDRCFGEYVLVCGSSWMSW